VNEITTVGSETLNTENMRKCVRNNKNAEANAAMGREVNGPRKVNKPGPDATTE